MHHGKYVFVVVIRICIIYTLLYILWSWWSSVHKIMMMITIRCSPEEAMTKIGGYTLALDMTDRQAQVVIVIGIIRNIYLLFLILLLSRQAEAKKKGHPWSISKGWDTSLPVRLETRNQIIFGYLGFWPQTQIVLPLDSGVAPSLWCQQQSHMNSEHYIDINNEGVLEQCQVSFREGCQKNFT